MMSRKKNYDKLANKYYHDASQQVKVQMALLHDAQGHITALDHKKVDLMEELLAKRFKDDVQHEAANINRAHQFQILQEANKKFTPFELAMNDKLASIQKFREETDQMKARVDKSKGKLTNIICQKWDQVTYMDNYMSNKESLNNLKQNRLASLQSITNGS